MTAYSFKQRFEFPASFEDDNYKAQTTHSL